MNGFGPFSTSESARTKPHTLACNPDNALHGFNLAKPFNGGLCFGLMGFRHDKWPFDATIFF
jgi:hypothetical protein